MINHANVHLIDLWLHKVFSLILPPLTSSSSSQAAVVKSQDLDVSQKTHVLSRWCGRTCCLCLLLWMSLHVHDPPPPPLLLLNHLLLRHGTHLPAQFQPSSVHSQKRRFITAAWLQHLAHQPLDFWVPVWPLCVCAAECVCVCLCLTAAWLCIGWWCVQNNSAVYVAF